MNLDPSLINMEESQCTDISEHDIPSSVLVLSIDIITLDLKLKVCYL